MSSKSVTHRYYSNIVYVTNPVDTDYESINVAVPVEIDGASVDAASAPILFNINVGGYTSSTPAGIRGGEDAGGGNAGLALAAGYVVVSPGCRGRDNYSSDDGYYGKAPAAIVDLKSAVRYLRYNDDIMPGNAEWIISSGSSDFYDAYLEAVGAADADENIFASACYCPITDLDHADMAYEWEFSGLLGSSDSTSQDLKGFFTTYQSSLNLTGQGTFGIIIADNYENYILDYYLIPSAEKYLSALTDPSGYLSSHTWIAWDGSTALFSYEDFVDYICRSKTCQAFDKTDLSSAENILFGDKDTDARHFTEYGNGSEIDGDLQTVVNLMNPMYFIGLNNSGCAGYWWIRHGTKDTDTSRPVIINLGTSLEELDKDVDTWLYWDADHGANEDEEEFIARIGYITGYNN